MTTKRSPNVPSGAHSAENIRGKTVSWQLIVAIVLSGVAVAWIAYAWWRKDHSGACWFGLFAFSTLLWNLSWAMRGFSSTEELALPLAYIAVLTVPLFVVRLVPVLVGHEETLGRRMTRWLYVYVAFVVVGVLTNRWHHGFWRFSDQSPSAHGPLFYVGAAVDYLAIVAGVAFYILSVWRAHSSYRRRILLILFAALLPVGASVLYFAGFQRGHEITWVLANVTLSVVGLGLFYMRLPEVLPTVTPFVLDHLRDGVVIVSPSGNIVYANAQGRRLLNVRKANMRSLETLNHSPLARHLITWIRTGKGPPRVTIPSEAGEQVVEIVFYTVPLAPNGKYTGVFLLRDITERARLEWERESRTRYLETIAHIDQYLLTVHRTEDLRQVFQHIGEALEADRVYVFEHTEVEDGSLAARLFHQYTRPAVPPFPADTFVYDAVGLGRWPKVLSSSVLICGPVETFPAREREWLQAQNVASIIIVPIFVGECLAGFVAADQVVHARDWSDAEKGFLLSVAASIRSTIERLRWEADLATQNRFLAHLNHVIQTAATATSLEALLPTLAAEFREAFSAAACYLFLWEVRTDYRGDPVDFRVTASAHAGEPVVEKAWKETPDLLLKRLMQTCAATETPLLLPEPDEQGIRWLVIPITGEEQAEGGAFLAFSGAMNWQGEALIEHARQFAQQVTLAINRVQLYHRLQNQNRQLNALYAVSASVVSLDPNEVLARALETLLEELEWDAGWVVIPDPVEGLEGLPQLAVEKNVPPTLRELATRYPICDCRACSLLYRHYELKTLLSVDECLHLRRDLLAQAGFHDVIGVPIRGSQETLGILFMVRRNTNRMSGQEGRELLLLLGQHIGTALENARLHASTREQALRDTLTGLYNRRFLIEHLDYLFNVSRRTGRPVSAIMVDIDHFKRFNDRYGHLEGDVVLRTVAHVIEANVRGTDTVVRYGGEEFTVILPETDRKEATLVAERLRRAVEEYPFRHYLFVDAQRITVSVGVATAPQDATTPEGLLEAADQALYAAKEAGRNRVVVYQELKVS